MNEIRKLINEIMYEVNKKGNININKILEQIIEKYGNCITISETKFYIK